MNKDKNVELKIENWNGNDIRFINLNGKWWAVLKDVCDALGLRTDNVANQLKQIYKSHLYQQKDPCNLGDLQLRQKPNRKDNETTLIEDVLIKQVLPTAGGPQEMLLISERGIYRAFLKSTKKKAFEFQEWILDVLEELRIKSGLEGFQVFRMADIAHQKQEMKKLHQGMDSKDRRNFCKANTIADKAVSTMFGFPKMLKKGQMNLEMLVARQPILNEVVELMNIKDKYCLDFSVSEKIYEKWT